jgi:hypothetical protein
MRQTLTKTIKFFFHHQDTKGTKKNTSSFLSLSWCLGVLVVNIYAFAVATPALPADLATLEGINRLLRAEYQLAKKDQLYIVLDLPAGQVQIKASGVVLASLPVQQWQRHGELGLEGWRTLSARQAAAAPQRITIDPQAEKAPGKFKLQALEMDDMPSAYRLLLDDGSALVIVPQAEGYWGQLAATLSRPLISGWHSLRRKPYTEVRLTLAAHDARRLYWSFQEGMPCLIAWRTP